MTKKKSFENYIDDVGRYYDKLPDLSKGAKSGIVSVVPWLVLIFGTLGLAVSVVGLGLITILEPILQVTGTKGSGESFFNVLLTLIASIILLSSFAGVSRKRQEGWKRLYYYEVVTLITNIIGLSTFGVFVSLVGFYILYQIREYYK